MYIKFEKIQTIYSMRNQSGDYLGMEQVGGKLIIGTENRGVVAWGGRR